MFAEKRQDNKYKGCFLAFHMDRWMSRIDIGVPDLKSTHGKEIEGKGERMSRIKQEPPISARFPSPTAQIVNCDFS